MVTAIFFYIFSHFSPFFTFFHIFLHIFTYFLYFTHTYTKKHLLSIPGTRSESSTSLPSILRPFHPHANERISGISIFVLYEIATLGQGEFVAYF